MMHWGNGMGLWGMAFMMVGNLLFWGLIIFGVVMLVRYLGRTGQMAPSSGQGSVPQQLLAERFARGEIDENEYGQRLQVLGETFAGKSS